MYILPTHFIFRLHILLNMYSFTNNQEVWEWRNASNTSSSILKNVSNILGYLEFPCLDEIATAFFLRGYFLHEPGLSWNHYDNFFFQSCTPLNSRIIPHDYASHNS